MQRRLPRPAPPVTGPTPRAATRRPSSFVGRPQAVPGRVRRPTRAGGAGPGAWPWRWRSPWPARARPGGDATAEREQRQDRHLPDAPGGSRAARGGHGDGVRAVVAAGRSSCSPGGTARVIAFSGIQLEASTFPEDQGDKAAPRRLSREEKPLYDRGQRLRAAVETNREEGNARKPESGVAGDCPPAGGGCFSAPVESGRATVVGMVELVSRRRDAHGGGGAVGWGPVLLAFLLPLLRARRRVLRAAAPPVACWWRWRRCCFVVGLGGYTVYSHARAGGRACAARRRRWRGTSHATAEKAQAVIAAQNLDGRAGAQARRPGTRTSTAGRWACYRRRVR